MKKHDKTVLTFTKKWVNRLMWLFVVWISLTYVLAFMGREAIVETLSEAVFSGGVVLFGGYMLKSFFETFSEEHMKYKKMCAGLGNVDESDKEDPEAGSEEGKE